MLVLFRMQKLVVLLVSAVILIVVVAILLVAKPQTQFVLLAEVKRDFDRKIQGWEALPADERMRWARQTEDRLQKIISENPQTSDAQEAREMLNKLYGLTGEKTKQAQVLLDLSRFQSAVQFNVNKSDEYYYAAINVMRENKVSPQELRKYYQEYVVSFPNSQHVEEIEWRLIKETNMTETEMKEMLKRFLVRYAGSQFAPQANVQLCNLLWKDKDVDEAFRGFDYLCTTYPESDEAAIAVASQLAILRKKKDYAEINRRLKALFLNAATGR